MRKFLFVAVVLVLVGCSKAATAPHVPYFGHPVAHTTTTTTVAPTSQPSAPKNGNVARSTTTSDSASACALPEQDYGATSVVSYQSTAGVVQTWKATRDSTAVPSLPTLNATAAAEPVAVCYLSGAFTGFPVPDPGDTYQQLIVEVDESTGSMTFDAASLSNKWPFEPPPAS
jgi:hypothetical protein